MAKRRKGGTRVTTTKASRAKKTKPAAPARKKKAAKAKPIARGLTEAAVTGACLVPDPNGGPSLCQQLDQATCARRGGVFLGGPC